MPTHKSLVAILVYLLFGLTAAQGDTVYVNNISGSDLNDGASPEHKGEGVGPLKSLTGALKRVQRGDRIELAKTTAPYQECVTLQGPRHSGTSYDPFVIDGNGASLEGIATVPAHRWEHVAGDIFRYVPARTGYQQLFLDGTPAKRMPKFDGVYNTSFLKPKQWCRCKGGIHFATEKNTSVHNYDLSYAEHRVGITLYDVENVVLHDLAVRGYQLDGINAHDNAFDCVLSQVTSTENGRSGVSAGGSSRLRLSKCELLDNGDSQFRAEGWSTSHLQDTKMVSNDVPVWKRQANQFGRGARLFINGTKQVETVGWWTESDEENDALKRGLDRVESEADSAEAIAAPPVQADPEVPTPVNPLENVADEEPAFDALRPTEDEPAFGDEAADTDDAPAEEDPFEDPFETEDGEMDESDDGGDELFDDFFE